MQNSPFHQSLTDKKQNSCKIRFLTIQQSLVYDYICCDYNNILINLTCRQSSFPLYKFYHMISSFVSKFRLCSADLHSNPIQATYWYFNLFISRPKGSSFSLVTEPLLKYHFTLLLVLRCPLLLFSDRSILYFWP